MTELEMPELELVAQIRVQSLGMTLFVKIRYLFCVLLHIYDASRDSLLERFRYSTGSNNIRRCTRPEQCNYMNIKSLPAIISDP